jgi:hypothetical protein
MKGDPEIWEGPIPKEIVNLLFISKLATKNQQSPVAIMFSSVLKLKKTLQESTKV